MASPSVPSDARDPQSNENASPSCQIEQEQRQIETPPIERGGYDCEFVERPKELETDCPVCLLVLRDPFQASCCGNSFCQSCIKRVQADKKSCPTCNEADFSVFADKRLRRSLYAFQVRCVHQKSGCEWTGELRELERHLNLNPELSKQVVGCAFAAVACTHCREYFQRRHVHAHESESCPQRPFSCDYCEDYKSVNEDVVTNHWPVCKCYPVPCPNECGVSPERQNVETHVNTVCPLTVVNCDFHYAGCEVQLVRKDMPAHLVEGLVTHLSLLALHNQQLTQVTLQQKESLEELKKENEVLKEKVNKNNKDVAREVAGLKESLEKSQLKIQELEREKQAQAIVTAKSKHDIEALTLKVNEELEREVAELRRQHDQDKVLLLHQYIHVFPIRLVITNFTEKKSNNRVWHSLPFYTHPQGYKLCLMVYANGRSNDEGDGEGTHVSMYANVMRGAFDDNLKWPFQGSVVLQLCNQLEDKRHCGHIISFREAADPKAISRVTGREIAESECGTPTLIAHNDLNFNAVNNCQYLKDDCLHFRIIVVESLSEPWVLPTELTMTNFEQHKIDSDRWFSAPFYTHPRGYKMCLKVDANGSGEGKGTYVTVGAYLMRGEFDDQLKWPFKGHVTVAMLNQLEDKNHTTKTIPFTTTADNQVIGRVTGGERAPSGRGYPTFIAHTDLSYKSAKNCQYLKYDCLRFRIVKVEPHVYIPSGISMYIKSMK